MRLLLALVILSTATARAPSETPSIPGNVATTGDRPSARQAEGRGEGLPDRRDFPLDPSRYLPMPLPDPRARPASPPGESRAVSYDMRTGQEVQWQVPAPTGLDAARVEGWPGRESPREFGEGVPEVRNFTDLELVNDPELFPWRVNVKVFMQFGSSYYVGSGVLVDPYHVLTAGHCVFDHGGTDDWADDITVVPAYENGSQPFGNAGAVSLHSWTGWTQDGSYDHDMGVIDLDRPIGALTGWHGYGYNNSNSFFTGNTFHNPGYPAASPYNGQYMYYWYGDFDLAGTYQLTFFKTAYGGQSGSGAYHLSDDQRTVYAVLSNGWSLWTNDVRITESKFSHIGGFIAEDTPAAYDLIAMETNIAPSSVTAGNALISMDYLVHNYSSASWSGSVPVTVYLSTNNDISPADTPIQDHSFSWSFGPMSSVRVTVSTPPAIPIATPSGSYYVGIILGVSDANAANNESDGQEASYVWVNGGPDLMVQNPGTAPSTIIAGTSTIASCTVRNQGGNSAGASILRYYLSSNTTYDAGDAYLGYDSVGSLPGGGTSSQSETLAIPAGTAGGTWYLLFHADAESQVSELNESNNVTALAVTVQPENIPPDAITDLAATGAAPDLLLSWSAPWDNVGVVGYWVYHHASLHDFGTPLVYLSGASTLSYSVPNACGDPASNHFYDVRARDAAGNVAASSNWVGEFDFSVDP
ncbi:trypsin-like serine protease [Candidatus Fermentibacteria bacterium]|nr:trypsin-like serine protease [Candidatus Fermentibacteria bacterium]